jgi:hypothetical protein
VVNCNNNGDCEYSNRTLSCFCKQNYQGNACQTFYNPCSTGPCLNGGVCTLKPMSSDPFILDFICVCNSTLYEGERCHLPIDYCLLNKTSTNTTSSSSMCNGHGTCESKNGAAICACTSYYYGTYCEYETSTVTQSEQIKKAATAFTVVGIITIYSIGIVFDVLRFGFSVV